jgi:hypothetical protein
MAKKMMGESKAEERKEEAKDKKQDIALIKKAFKEHDKQEHKGGKGTKITLKKGGVTGQAMRAVGRNLARAHNQKAGSK